MPCIFKPDMHHNCLRIMPCYMMVVYYVVCFFPVLLLRVGSDNVAFVRIRSTSFVCLLHGLVLLPCGISVCRCRCYWAGDSTELKEELDEDLVHCVVSFQLISSGAQLGRSGICVAFGVVFFYFGSIVGP
ncbi:hypothetical protein VPH35_001663 [Triticum aestivum]